VFIIAKKDMERHVAVLRKNIAKDPDAAFLMMFMLDGMTGKKTFVDDDGSTASAAYWICNMVEYMTAIFRVMSADPELEVDKACIDAYEYTMKLHHGPFLQTMFAGFFKAMAPYRKDVVPKCGDGLTNMQLIDHMQHFVKVVTPVTNRINEENPRMQAFARSQALGGA